MPREKKPAAIAMPILALRGLMVFPHMVLHFDVGREKSVAALEQAMMESQEIFLVAQRDADVEDPTVDQLCRVGTIAHIKQVLNLPGDSLRVLVEGLRRATLETITQEEPYLLGKVRPEPERPEEESIEMQALVRTTQDFFAAYAAASQRVSAETVNSVREVEAPDQLADVIAANVLTHLEDRQAILEELDVKTRLEKLCTILARETELAGVEKQVQARIKKQIEKNQKDYYLREQIKAIQTELGDKEATDVEDLRDRLEHTPVNDEAREKLQKELERPSRMAPGTPEVGVSRTWVEWILDLPWGKTTTDNLDLKRARKVLSQDHYGLDKVKERIVEYLAVLRMKQDMKGPILCFVGPPGVGKTSIVKAIAQAVDPQDLFRSTGQAYVRLAREEPHLFQLYLFQPRDQVASLADLYARETNPAVPAKIAADLGISPEAAQALHLHLLIYTIGIGTIFSVTSPGIPQEEIFQQQEEAYQAFLHHCLGGTQP